MNSLGKRIFLYIIFILISIPCFGQISWLSLPFDITMEGNSKWENNPFLESSNRGIVKAAEEGHLLVPFFNIEKSLNVILDQMGFGATVSFLSGPMAKNGGVESEIIIRYIYHFPGFTRKFDCFAEGGFGLGFDLNKHAVSEIFSLIIVDNSVGNNDLLKDKDFNEEFIRVSFSPHLALGLRVFIENFFITLKIIYPIITFDFSEETYGEDSWRWESLNFYISIGQSIDLFN